MSNTFYILEEKRLAQGQPLDLVVLEPHDVHGVVHVDGHGVACPLGVSLAEEVHEQGVVPAGVLRQLVLVLAGGDGP